MIHDHDTKSSTRTEVTNDCQNLQALSGGIRRAAGGAPGPVGGEAASLEPKNNTVIKQDSQSVREDARCSNGKMILRPKRCQSRFCPRCGVARGIKLRQDMLAVSDLFPRPLLLTLTIDREGTKTDRGFPCAESAYEYVHEGRYIARLMELIGVKRWVVVLEFQSRTGDGWPHWHVLIDASDCPRGRLPKDQVVRLWKFWRYKWGIGSVDVQQSKLTDSRHACMYITKYLTKPPKRGWPRWVLEREKKVRLISSSREVGALVGDSIKRDKATKEKRDTPAHRPAYKMVASCCQSTLAFREETVEEIDYETGEAIEVKQTRYVGEVQGRLSELYKMACTRSDGPDIEKVEVQGMGYTMDGYEITKPVSLFALQRWAEDTGETQAAIDNEEHREQVILAHWEKFPEKNRNKGLTHTSNTSNLQKRKSHHE